MSELKLHHFIDFFSIVFLIRMIDLRIRSITCVLEHVLHLLMNETHVLDNFKDNEDVLRELFKLKKKDLFELSCTICIENLLLILAQIAVLCVSEFSSSRRDRSIYNCKVRKNSINVSLQVDMCL